MFTDEECDALRSRLYKLNDRVEQHTITLAEHHVMIGDASHQLDVVRSQMSTREQLDGAVAAVKVQLENSVALMTLNVQAVRNDLAPIKRGINWAVMLILGAVLTALIALVVKQ